MHDEKNAATHSPESSAEALPPQADQPAAEAGQDEGEKKYQELQDQFVRLAADFDNFRKRHHQDVDAARKSATEQTLQELVPVFDNLERATGSLSESSDPKVLYQSFQLMTKQLLDTLGNLGLKRMETVGKPFDPNFHEAVTQVPTDEHPDQTVVSEMQSGFMLYDRVLRPAMVAVSVSSGAGAAGAEERGEESEENPFQHVASDATFKPESE
jgi:molecular chaperone GrpE